VVSMLTSFMHSWLTPRLPDLFANHPEIDLRLQCSPQLVDFARSDVHVAIRMGRGQWPRLHCERLFPEYLVPLCTPSLLAKHGTIGGPGPDSGAHPLGKYPLLHSSTEPWEMWTEHGEDPPTMIERWPDRGAAFDDSVAILHAAVLGQGLVLSRWSLAQPFLESGQLVRASAATIRYSYDCFFVCPEAYLELNKVAAFRDWLHRRMADMPQPAKVS